MASGNFTNGSMTPSITQLAACGSTSNVVSGGHQFEGRAQMQPTEYKAAQQKVALAQMREAQYDHRHLCLSCQSEYWHDSTHCDNPDKRARTCSACR